MWKKILIIGLTVILIAVAVYFIIDNSKGEDSGPKLVKVEKGNIVDKALAVGRIEPRQEVAVKSKISGIVRKIYVEVGDLVKAGRTLMDIAPDPTPIEFAEAKRQVEIYEVAFNNAKREYDRAQTLVDRKLISSQDYESKKAAYDESELRLKLAREKLQLIQSGTAEIADRTVDNTIKSPIDGMVLSRLVEEGDPVVPLTSYQAGTELMTLAIMEDLIFMGTVDEIDVGKIKTGMLSEIKIGALPKDTIRGIVDRISPKAHRDQGSTVFDVEIKLTDLGSGMLRAGYSANADIIINRKDSIILVPERLITFKNDSSFVECQDTLGKVDTVMIVTGLSDGINIEITEGLTEGQMLVERPPRQILD